MKQKLKCVFIAVIFLLSGCAWQTVNLQQTRSPVVSMSPASLSSSAAEGTEKGLVSEDNDGPIRLGMTRDELLDVLIRNSIPYERDAYGNIDAASFWISFDEQSMVQYIHVKNMPTAAGLEKGSSKEDMVRIYGETYLDIGEEDGTDIYLYSMIDYSFILTFAGNDNPVVSEWKITNMGDYAWDRLAGLYGVNPDDETTLTYETYHFLNDGLPQYRFTLEGQKRDNYSFVEAKELVIWDGERIVQTIDLHNTGAGEYPESFSIETSLIIEDVNFDGYKDLRFVDFIANANVGYLYWIWDAAQFVRAPELEALISPVFDHENSIAYSYMRESAVEHHEYAYRFIDGKPTMFKHIAEGLVDSENPNVLYRITYVLVGGEMKEVVKVRIDDEKAVRVQRPSSRVEIITMEGYDEAISVSLYTALDGFSFYYDSTLYSVYETDGIVKVYSLGAHNKEENIMVFEHLIDQPVDDAAAALFSEAVRKYDIAEWIESPDDFSGLPLEDGSVISNGFKAYAAGFNPDKPYMVRYLLDDGKGGCYVFTKIIGSSEGAEGYGVRYGYMMRTFVAANYAPLLLRANRICAKESAPLRCGSSFLKI